MSETFESIDYSKESTPPTPATDSNLYILYITFAIIVGMLLIWIIIVMVTKEDPLKILNEMNNLASQMAPVSDNLSYNN